MECSYIVAVNPLPFSLKKVLTIAGMVTSFLASALLYVCLFAASVGKCGSSQSELIHSLSELISTYCRYFGHTFTRNVVSISTSTSLCLHVSISLYLCLHVSISLYLIPPCLHISVPHTSMSPYLCTSYLHVSISLYLILPCLHISVPQTSMFLYLILPCLHISVPHTSMSSYHIILMLHFR